jgi:hypothetical protein
LYQTPRTCSASCGGGIATQNVTCKAMGYGEDGCTFSEARGADLSCNAFDCELYVWNVGMWSACSATCDGMLLYKAARSVPQSTDLDCDGLVYSYAVPWRPPPQSVFFFFFKFINFVLGFYLCAEQSKELC